MPLFVARYKACDVLIMMCGQHGDYELPAPLLIFTANCLTILYLYSLLSTILGFCPEKALYTGDK